MAKGGTSGPCDCRRCRHRLLHKAKRFLQPRSRLPEPRPRFPDRGGPALMACGHGWSPEEAPLRVRRGEDRRGRPRTAGAARLAGCHRGARLRATGVPGPAAATPGRLCTEPRSQPSDMDTMSPWARNRLRAASVASAGHASGAQRASASPSCGSPRLCSRPRCALRGRTATAPLGSKGPRLVPQRLAPDRAQFRNSTTGNAVRQPTSVPGRVCPQLQEDQLQEVQGECLWPPRACAASPVGNGD